MRSALVVIALASAASLVHAGSITQWDSLGCTGTKQRETFTSGSCKTSGDSSGLVTCFAAGTTMNWNFTAYSSTDCTGTPDLTYNNGVNDVCTDLAQFEISLKVDCNGCFSGVSTLQLESGASANIADVKVGDRVLSVSTAGQAVYDKVFRITHHEPSEVMDFVRITTSSGEVLEVSPTHTVHVDTCCAAGNAITAGEVKVGNKMFVAQGAGQAMKEVTVTAVEIVSRTGVYNLHTLGSNVVVNGVAATHYGKPAWTAAPSLATYWYHARDMMSSVLGAEDASVKDPEATDGVQTLVARMMASKEATHGSLRA